MHTLITVFHVVMALFLILVVLLQSGKGANMGAAFGSGSSQTMFGSSGAGNFLTKLTTAAAIIFMITSFSLATISKGTDRDSVVNEIEETTKSVPSQDNPAE